MNYFQLRRLAIRMSNTVKGFIRTIIGAPPVTLTDCVDDKSVINYQIYGNSVQDGEASPSNPIYAQSVGDNSIFDWGVFSTSIDQQGYPYFDISTLPIGTVMTVSTKDEFVYKISSLSGSSSIYQSNKTTNQAITLTSNMITAGRLYFIKTTYSAAKLADLENQNIKITIDKYRIPGKASSEDGESVTTNIYLNEPLRAIGDYKDYLEYENRKCVRKVAESQFLSKYIQGKSGSSNDVFFRCLVSASSPFGKAKVGKDVPIGFNSVGEVNTFSLPLITDKVVWHNNANTTTFFDIPVALLTAGGYTNDLAGVKAWVDAQNAVNPIMITYILETPIEEDIKLPILPTFKGNTTYTIDTTVQPTEMSVTYYSNTKGE